MLRLETIQLEFNTRGRELMSRVSPQGLQINNNIRSYSSHEEPFNL